MSLIVPNGCPTTVERRQAGRAAGCDGTHSERQPPGVPSSCLVHHRPPHPHRPTGASIIWLPVAVNRIVEDDASRLQPGPAGRTQVRGPGADRCGRARDLSRPRPGRRVQPRDRPGSRCRSCHGPQPLPGPGRPAARGLRRDAGGAPAPDPGDLRGRRRPARPRHPARRGAGRLLRAERALVAAVRAGAGPDHASGAAASTTTTPTSIA